jgi:magnesium transporter
MNQLTRSNTWRTISREISVALLNGVTIATLLGLGAGLIFANPQLGAVIAAAMMINIVVAGLSGVVIPVVLERSGQDPAVSSSVFVTMITDSMGFLVFLGLAVATGLVA